MTRRREASSNLRTDLEFGAIFDHHNAIFYAYTETRVFPSDSSVVLTGLRHGVMPPDDVSVAVVELTMAGFGELVVVKLHDVPDVDATRHNVEFSPYARLDFLPALPEKKRGTSSIDEPLKTEKKVSKSTATRKMTLIRRRVTIDSFFACGKNIV